jgi:hypothetical protein
VVRFAVEKKEGGRGGGGGEREKIREWGGAGTGRRK